MNQGDLKKNDYFVLLRVKNVIWLQTKIHARHLFADVTNRRGFIIEILERLANMGNQSTVVFVVRPRCSFERLNKHQRRIPRCLKQDISSVNLTQNRQAVSCLLTFSFIYQVPKAIVSRHQHEQIGLNSRLTRPPRFIQTLLIAF